MQSDWKSEVLPLHKYAVEDHLKLSVHNNGEKERIQTLGGGQFDVVDYQRGAKPLFGWGSWTRTNERQGLARVKVWCLTILATPQYIIKEPHESICKNQKTEGKSSEEELDIEL